MKNLNKVLLFAISVVIIIGLISGIGGIYLGNIIFNKTIYGQPRRIINDGIYLIEVGPIYDIEIGKSTIGFLLAKKEQSPDLPISDTTYYIFKDNEIETKMMKTDQKLPYLEVEDGKITFFNFEENEWQQYQQNLHQ